MKKKIIELVCMAVILTVCANGCTASETNKNGGVKKDKVVETEKVLSPESAVDIYMKNKDLWMENPEYDPMQGYGYCLLDLDFDGVLELINSVNDGSGRYSYNKYFRINNETLAVERILSASGDEVEEDGYDYKYAAHDATKLLRNSTDNTLFYYCTNHTRITTGEGGSVYGKLILNEGRVGEEIIFSEYYCDAGIYDNEEDIRSFKYLENGEMKKVTEAEYNERHAEYFEENTDLNLQWVCIEGREFDDAGIMAKKQMLLDAYKSFSYDGFSFDKLETYDIKTEDEVTVKEKALWEVDLKKAKQYSMTDYKGMTIGDVAKIWGNDYTILDFIYAGGSAIICYEDWRCPFYFHIAATEVPESCKGDELLTHIEINLTFEDYDYNDYMVIDGLPVTAMYSEISQKLPGEAGFAEMGGFYYYSCCLDDGTYISFDWGENEESMKQEIPNCIGVGLTEY